MIACPNCGKSISIWHSKDAFPCAGCGGRIKTNGLVIHAFANLIAGFGCLVVLFVPELECNNTLQLVALMASFAAIYFAVIWVFYSVTLDSSEHEKP